MFEGLTEIYKGLSSDEARKRLEIYGYNEIREEVRVSEVLRFISQFRSPLIYLLIFSGIVTLFLDKIVDSIIIFAVVLVSAVIGYLQERQAKRTIDALKKLIEIKARVLRDGIVKDVPAREVVPGDVVLLESGMKVPADGRLVKAKNLSVDESLLTGESIPVEKSVGDEVFAGTLVVGGSGVAVVDRTGERTELGKIAKSVRMEEEVETPLIKKIKRFSKIIFYAVVLISAVNFVVGVVRGYDSSFTFLASVSLAVALIPESLPALVTMTLAIGVRDMARRNAVVRHLPAVETLGGVTVICTDKTGTLTKNEMTVVKIFAGNEEFEVGEKIEGVAYLTLKTGYICNKRSNPTEIALLKAAEKYGINVEFEIIDEIPFDSSRKFMAVTVRENGRIYTYVKGSPEKILRMCEWKLVDGRIEKLDEGYEEIASGYAEKGLRVLAFAYKEGTGLDDLVFLGFQCMVDPPREESYSAVEKCKSAGVRVIMLTGDHPKTAQFIAKELGIDGEVLTGREVEEMSDENLKEALERVNVFARVSPEIKLRIVKILKEMGEVVAVTGDGVNDAPALKSADIGVAMGSGTEVAKEASEIILLDDNFATIVDAIEEGRNVFRKIQRILEWLLPTNLGEGLIVLVAFMLGIALPILPVQILWINTVTAVLLGTMLVFGREENLLKLRPLTGELVERSTALRVISISLLMVLCAYVLYFKYGGGEGRTVAMNAIVFFEIFYLIGLALRILNAVPGIVATGLLQILATYSLNDYLHTVPIDVKAWIYIIALTFPIAFIRLIRRS